MVPGLLVSSEEELALGVLGFEVNASLANEGFLIIARVVVPSVTSGGLMECSAHLFLVLRNNLGLSSGPEFPVNSVLLGSIGPVPLSLVVVGVSTNPGLGAVSSDLRDFVLLTVVVDRDELTTVLRGTGITGVGPSLLGSKEFVLEFISSLVLALVFEGKARLGSLKLHAHERHLLATVVVAESGDSSLGGVAISDDGTAILILESVGEVGHPVGFENLVGTLLVSDLFVRPSPGSVLFEVVVSNPDSEFLHVSESRSHNGELSHGGSGSEISTSFTAVASSSVPGLLALLDPESPGASVSVRGRSELADISRPVNVVSGVDTEDLTSSTDRGGGGFAEVRVFVSGVVDLDPFFVVGLDEVSVLLGGNEGAFSTDGDVDEVGALHGHPSASVSLLTSVDLSVFTEDNGVSISFDGDLGSGGGGEGGPCTLGVMVVDLTVLSNEVDMSFGSDSDVDDSSEGTIDLDPFLGVEGPNRSTRGDSPGVSVLAVGNSDGTFEATTDLSPDVLLFSVLGSDSVSVDHTILASNVDELGGSGGDVDSLNVVTESEFNLVDFLHVLGHEVLVVVLALSGSTFPGSHDLGHSFEGSADEGSLLFAVNVVPSSVLLEGKAISAGAGFVGSPVLEGEVSVVVRPSPKLVLASLDGVVASTDPNFVSLLDILVLSEFVVLVLGEGGGEVPSLLFTVSLGVVPVKGELGGEVVDSLLSGLTRLGGPGGFTVSGDNVGVSVLADSKSLSSLSVESVPVVSSGVLALSLDVFPESHVLFTGLVHTDDHKVTARSRSDIHGASFELRPGISTLSVLDGLPDSAVLADDVGLSIELNRDSVGVTRGVSVSEEFAFVEEGDLASSVDNPDLSVGASADINSLHLVGFPGGGVFGERLHGTVGGDDEDGATGGDSNSLGVLDADLSFPGFSTGSLLVDLTVSARNVNILGSVNSNIVGSLAHGPVDPGDLVLSGALLSSLDAGGVVGEDLSGARVVDESHGGSGGAVVGLGGKTDEGSGLVVEVLVDVAVGASLVSDHDSLSSDKSDLESGSDLLTLEGVPEVLDVGDFAAGLLVELDGLASEEGLSLELSLVEVVVEVVELESQLGEEALSSLLRVTEGDLVELGKPVDVLSLSDDFHSLGVSAGKGASEHGALLSGDETGRLATDGAFADESLLFGALVGEHVSLVSSGATSNKGGASFLLLSLSDGPVADLGLVGPLPLLLEVLSSNPGGLVVDALDGHQVHESSLLSGLADGGEVASPSLASGLGLVPGLGSLVIYVVLKFLLFDAGVDGPVDFAVLADNEGSSSFADRDLTGRSSHVPELAVLAKLEDLSLLASDVDGSFGTGTDIVSGLGRLVVLPGRSVGGLLVDVSFLVDNPKLSGGSNVDTLGATGLLLPASLDEGEDLVVGGGNGDSATGSGSDILGFGLAGEADLLPEDTVPSEELSTGGGDPWATVGLNGDSGGELRSDLGPGLAVPSVGDAVSGNNPDGIVGSDRDVLGVSGSLFPCDGLEGEASLGVRASDSGYLFVAHSSGGRDGVDHNLVSGCGLLDGGSGLLDLALSELS